MGRFSILSIDDLSCEDIQNIIDISFSMDEVLGRDIKKIPTLRGKVVALMFFEPSTRTRISFELASKFVSADTVNFSTAGSSIEKGESLIDTIRTISSLGVDFLVIRHNKEGVPHIVAEHSDISVINAGDGKNEHPTQALLDLFTMMKRKKLKSISDMKNLSVSIVGDILHSRVARSNIKLLRKLGVKINVVSAYTTLPQGIDKVFDIKVKNFIDEEVLESDFIMALRLQKERHAAVFYPSDREFNFFWGLKEEQILKLKDRVIMHPGPMNLGVEIMPAVAYSELSAISEQVRNGVAVRMAILFYIFRGGKIGID